MSNTVYKQVEITGTSSESISAAIATAVEKASHTLHNMKWFEVTELRGSIEDGKVEEYQVSIKVGFKLDE
jgi:flavin-binding protein dodecin